MSFKNSTVLFSLLAVLILFNSFFIVDEREKAIVLQFGETVREDVGVGFHFKVPIIQEVKKFDARLRSLDEDQDRILTNESKYLLVDSFGCSCIHAFIPSHLYVLLSHFLALPSITMPCCVMSCHRHVIPSLVPFW